MFSEEKAKIDITGTRPDTDIATQAMKGWQLSTAPLESCHPFIACVAMSVSGRVPVISIFAFSSENIPCASAPLGYHSFLVCVCVFGVIDIQELTGPTSDSH